MINVAIVGATGYTGIELVKLLLMHPSVNLKIVTTTSQKGKLLASLYPSLLGQTDLILSEFSMIALKSEKIDVIFLALPNGQAMNQALILIDEGFRVIDLSADFRFQDVELYENTYKINHTSKELIKKAVYGLPEIYASTVAIQNATLIANPGCYVTASLLGLYPLLAMEWFISASVIIDAKSGVSGAGKSLTDATHFIAINETVTPYKIASHRHRPEIEQVLGHSVTFTPHLIPITRGILATIYVQPVPSAVSLSLISELFQTFYKNKPFVHIAESGVTIGEVQGTNHCHISLSIDEKTHVLIITSVIDNLLKGAAGQAIQNMNLMFDIDQTIGLPRIQHVNLW